MKLSHLTIAISAAIGLAACGGSGSDDAVDNSTPTTPTNPTPTNPTPADPTPSKPEVDQNGLEKPVDPKRQVPTGEVEANVKPQVDAAKKAYVDRQTRDSVTGYNIIQGGGLNVKGVEIGTEAQNRTASYPPNTPPNTKDHWVTNMETVQDGSLVAPNPFQVVGLNARPAYAALGDMAIRNNKNEGTTYAVSARAYRNAGFPAYANQSLAKFQTNTLDRPEGQAGLVFYTGSTKVNNPTNAGNGDLQRDASIINYKNQTPLKANGGIQANPDFSYALVDGDFYRVVPENVNWSDITPATTFKTVIAGKKAGIPMDEILFIPNAAVGTDGLNVPGATVAQAAHKAGSTASNIDNTGTLGVSKNTLAGINVIRNSQLGRLEDYDLNRGIVEFQDFTLAGKSYDLSQGANFDNIALDLTKVPSSRDNKKVNEMKIGLNYTVHDAKATGTKTDDHWIPLSAEAGALKIYELPYHRTIVSINQAAVDDPNGPLARASNMFGFAGFNDFEGDGQGSDGHFGPYQVLGYNQGTLPENGRADYRGKSFGVNSEGTLNLRADFGKERASVYGAVTDRKRLDSTAAILPDLNLKPILLSQPATREHYASKGMLSSSSAPNGIVTRGSNANWGTWAVSFYGPNAEEAGGVIAEGVQLDSTALINVKEVFSGERGQIIGDGSGSASGSLN